MKPKPFTKLDLNAPAAPLQANPFSALAGLSADLPPGPAEVPPVPSPSKPTKPRGRLILRRETKDRGGKTVVVISGFTGNPQEREALARRLRKELGCGGTVDGNEIVIQGDRPAAVAERLRGMGFAVGGVVA